MPQVISRLVLVKTNAYTGLMEKDVPSPCVSLCKLDESGTYCVGCLRTRSEIAVWSSANTQDKRAILERVKERRKTLD